MSTAIVRSFTRYVALPVVSAGIFAGAALGFAGTAAANPDHNGYGHGHGHGHPDHFSHGHQFG
jgi:hypothetical protein